MEIDRVIVPDDEKKRVLDLSAMALPVPTVGIYEGELRYYAASLEWAKIIEGHVSWLASIAAWQDSEDEGYEAIQQISIFLEGIEAGGMATKADIRDGIYEAANRIALQIASGQYSNLNFSTDADGIVTPAPEAGDVTSSLPEDDPTTFVDESAAAKMGGTIALGKAIELFLDKMDSYYGATNGTPTTTATDTKFYIKNYFPCDNAAMDTAIDGYYTYRGTNARILFDGTSAFYRFLFCKGSNETAWNKWLADASTFVAAKIQVITNLTAALGDTFWSGYFAQGITLPSTDYLESSCYPSPTEVMNILLLGTTYNSQTAWKNSHRLLFTVENYFTDVDGDIVDFWWYQDPPALPVNRIASVSIQLGTGITKPTINQVPYTSSHKYQFTIDTPAASGSVAITIPSTTMNAPITPSVAGVGIKVTIQDLGEYTV